MISVLYWSAVKWHFAVKGNYHCVISAKLREVWTLEAGHGEFSESALLWQMTFCIKFDRWKKSWQKDKTILSWSVKYFDTWENTLPWKTNKQSRVHCGITQMCTFHEYCFCNLHLHGFPPSLYRLSLWFFHKIWFLLWSFVCEHDLGANVHNGLTSTNKSETLREGPSRNDSFLLLLKSRPVRRLLPVSSGGNSACSRRITES